MSVLSGMTGFARVAGEAEWGSWAWEAKSVNGRGLDVRVNYPPGFEALDRAIKSAAPKYFKRGSLQVALRIDLASGADTATINNALLDALAAAVEKRTGTALSGDVFASLMNVKGVVEPGASSLRDLAGDETVISLLAQAGDEALKALQAERQREGGTLAELLEGLVASMEAHWRQAGDLAGTQPALLKERLT